MKKKKLAPGILTIHFLILISYSSITVLTLLSLFFEHLGGSPRRIGFLMSLFAFAAFLSRTFGGWLLSNFNARKIMIAGLLLMLAMTSLYPFIQELNWFVVFIRIFHGLGFSIFVLAALWITVSLVREEERAYAIGIVSTGFMLPLLVFPFLGEEIIQRFGFLYFFLCAIFLSVIPLVYVLFVKLDIPRYSEDPKTRSAGYLLLLKQKRIYLILLLSLVFEIGLSSCLVFVPLLAHGESFLRAGYYYTFLALSAVFVRVIGGRHFRFWGSPRLILPAFCLISGGGLLIFFSSSNFLLGASGLIYGIGIGILYPHLSALIVRGVTSRERGKVLSLFTSSVDLGFAFGPLFFGWIYQSIGIRQSFALFSAFIFLSSLGLILWGRKTIGVAS
jgi:predicted MFS family arabinose efflux permease